MKSNGINIISSVLIIIMIFFTDAGKVLAQQSEDKPVDEKKDDSSSEDLNETEDSKENKTVHYYFYKEDDSGSRAFHTPWNLFIEGGFGALHNRKIDDFHFRDGADSLCYNISHPFSVISDYGWKNFFMDEVIPNPYGNDNYIANWTWHLIGGGFRCKMMEEYYIYHGYSYPKLMAWITMYSMHFTNEAVQQETLHGPVDPIADLYIFDFLGKLLFEIDAVSYFASEYLHLTDWTYQTQLDPQKLRLLNNGELFWVRLNIYGRLSGSILTGELTNSFGLTWEFSHGRQLSFGCGGKAKTFKTAENGRPEADRMSLTAGAYYSIDDNPMVVITYEPAVKVQNNTAYDPREVNEYSEKLIINLYPGLLKIFGRTFGLSLQYNQEAFFFGFTTALLPVGIIGSTPQKEKYDRCY